MTPEQVITAVARQAEANREWCEQDAHDWTGGWRADIGSCASCWSCGVSVPQSAWSSDPGDTRLPDNLNELCIVHGVPALW